jgi:hypothetical protein
MSGSPVFLKIGSRYVILGVYKGDQPISGGSVGKYTKLKVEKFTPH